MELREFDQDIATACGVRAGVVQDVQTETFNRLLAAVEKGERVLIPGFGIFLMSEVADEGGGPPRQVLRFRRREADEKSKVDAGKDAADKDARRARRLARAAEQERAAAEPVFVKPPGGAA